MSVTAPAIILVQPQMGENIGMAARAMFNCGLTELRLVRPRDGWPSAIARDNAAGADEVIDGVGLYDTAAEAVADLHRVYATTARPRNMVTRVMVPRQAAADMRDWSSRRVGQGGEYGILFGAERSGLDNDCIALADVVIEAPLNPAFTSLNLAQAVLLVAWEWHMAGLEDGAGEVDSASNPAGTLRSTDSRPATMGELAEFLTRLEGELEAGRFFKAPELRPVVIRNIRNMFQRAELTEQEVRTLHGIVSAVKRARLPHM